MIIMKGVGVVLCHEDPYAFRVHRKHHTGDLPGPR